MIKKMKSLLAFFIDKKVDVNNLIVSKRQRALLKLIIFISMLLFAALIGVLQSKVKSKDDNAKPSINKVKVDLVDKSYDTEKHWREFFEAERSKDKEDTNSRLEAMEKAQSDLLARANKEMSAELSLTKQKLEMAKAELIDASLELRKVASDEKNKADLLPSHKESPINVQSIDQEVVYDKPKSAENYIPEGTYFTGHLLGGMAVSTGLNAPDENATPVSIQLLGKVSSGSATTNLSKLNKLDLANCIIMGSSYGDISSERAIVRLEKMVCLSDNLYTTSKISGQIFGPDGLNGIKGKVVSTSSKHLKNAMLGGMISGFSSGSKGRDSMSLSSLGMISTNKVNPADSLKNGAMQGVGNIGDKLAEYYLRQAEAMSPVLTVPAGVRINAQITKGFFVGEISTHKKIQSSKK